MISNGEKFTLELNFADGDTREVQLMDQNITVPKMYNKPNDYNLSATILENGLSYNTTLSGKK